MKAIVDQTRGGCFFARVFGSRRAFDRSRVPFFPRFETSTCVNCAFVVLPLKPQAAHHPFVSFVSHTTVRASSSSGRQSRVVRIVAKDQNSRPSLDDVAEFKTSPEDTGSASVQIALLTKRIENLTAHLQANRKDYSTQRGLKMLLGKRGRLQKYLAKKDPAKYQTTMKGLGLKVKSA